MSINKKIRDQIASNVQLRALGNSNRSMRDVCVDLINASKLDWEEIAAGAYLCKSTVGRLATEQTKNPQLETVERIMKFFDCRVDLKGEIVRGPNLLQPKHKRR